MDSTNEVQTGLNKTRHFILKMNNITDPMDPITLELRVDAIMYIIFSIVGIFANILIIVSILKTYRLRHSGFHICIVWLASVDIVFLCNVPVVTVELADHRSWIAGIVMCKLYTIAFTYGVYAKKLLLLAITGIHIHRVRLMSTVGFTITRRNALIVGLALCVIIFSLTLPVGAFSEVYSFGSVSYCSPNHGGSHRYYMWVLLGLAILFEGSIIVITIVLAVYLCMRKQALKASDGDGKLSAMLIVQLLMELCTTAILIGISRIYGMFVVFMYVPSFLRPVLYLVFCPLLRRTYIWFLTCGGLCGYGSKDETLLVPTEEVQVDEEG